MAFLSLFIGVIGHADEPRFRYREQDGTIWISNHPMSRNKPGKYRFIGHHSKDGKTDSCIDITPQSLRTKARPYQSMIQHQARRFRVDPQLVNAIIMVESCFDSRAVSHSGARGLMQLMPPTAADMEVTNSWNAQQNIRGGVRYFRAMLDRFDSDITIALAAYHAGPGTLERNNRQIPSPTTQRYIERVLAHYQRFLKKPLAP